MNEVKLSYKVSVLLCGGKEGGGFSILLHLFFLFVGGRRLNLFLQGLGFLAVNLEYFFLDVFPSEGTIVVVGRWIVVEVKIGLKVNFFSVDLGIKGLFLFAGGEEGLGGIFEGVGEGDLHDLDFFGGVVFNHFAMGEDVFSFDAFLDVELSLSAEDNLNQFGADPNVKYYSNKEQYIIAYRRTLTLLIH